MSKREILAVHRNKLEEFLKGLGLWDSLVKGELRCFICGGMVTPDKIGFIVPSGREILFCCSGPECVLELKEMRGGRR